MLFGIAGLLLLVPIGYALMFGMGPIPELGAAGLGYRDGDGVVAAGAGLPGLPAPLHPLR